MPTELSPQARWRSVSVPVFEEGLDQLERGQRVVAGSLVLWASRIIGFRWSDYPQIEAVYNYCSARINGAHGPQRPSDAQLLLCLREIGPKLDAEARVALARLAEAASRATAREIAGGPDVERIRTDFSILTDAPGVRLERPTPRARREVDVDLTSDLIEVQSPTPARRVPASPVDPMQAAAALRESVQRRRAERSPT